MVEKTPGVQYWKAGSLSHRSLEVTDIHCFQIEGPRTRFSIVLDRGRKTSFNGECRSVFERVRTALLECILICSNCATILNERIEHRVMEKGKKTQ